MNSTYTRFFWATTILFIGWVVLQSATSEIRIGSVRIQVQVAENARERMQGLSGKAFLGENEGMLFVFEKPGIHGFWMKDMNFAINILWIDKDKRVVDITLNVAPDTFPETFYPKEPIQYVLETRAGWVEQSNIVPGDIVTGL